MFAIDTCLVGEIYNVATATFMGYSLGGCGEEVAFTAQAVRLGDVSSSYISTAAFRWNEFVDLYLSAFRISLPDKHRGGLKEVSRNADQSRNECDKDHFSLGQWRFGGMKGEFVL